MVIIYLSSRLGDWPKVLFKGYDIPFVISASHKLADISKLGGGGIRYPMLGYSTSQLSFREMEALRGRTDRSFIGSREKLDPGVLPGTLSSVLLWDDIFQVSPQKGWKSQG